MKGYILPPINNKQKAEYKKYIKIRNKKKAMSIKKYYPKLNNLINKSFGKLSHAHADRDKNSFNLPNE